MACDRATAAHDAACFMCISEKQLMAMQAYSAWQAWRAADPGAPSTVQGLLDAAKGLTCGASHKQLWAATAWALCNLNNP